MDVSNYGIRVIRLRNNDRINSIPATKGDFIQSGAQIAQILQVTDVKVSVGIPESDVASLFELESSEVVIEALGKKVS